MNERLINQINFDIREILPPITADIPSEDLTNNIHINQFLEKAQEINQLNLGNTGSLSEDLSYILNVDDINLKGIGYASIAGIHTYNGNYKKALVGLNNALNLKVNNDVKAYIYTEYANLLRLLKRIDEALAVFNRALELTENDNLKWRIHTYIGYTVKYNNSEKAIKILNKSADYYLKNNNIIRYTTVLRHIGVLHSENSEHRKAKRYQTLVKKLADQYSLDALLDDVQNGMGWTLVLQKKYEQARSIFIELLSKDAIPYNRSLVLQNLGVLEFECENYDKAIDYHKKSLEITLENEMSEMLFEDYYKIGLSYEKLGDYYNANEFYKTGYSKLQEERAELGIILMTGFRKTLIDNYIRFLENKPYISTANLHPDTFGFTEGKIYTELLDSFQKNLLKIHRRRHKTIEQLCDTLDISLRLYFVYQNRFGLSRLEMKEKPDINNHFENYLFSLTHLDWRSAKNQFDNDLYKFLLAKHGYNKTKIAQILDVSNLTVIKKTAELN